MKIPTKIITMNYISIMMLIKYKIIKLIANDIIKLKINNVKKWIIVGKNPGSYNYKYKGF